MADQGQKQQSQKEYGTSEIDARHEVADQSVKDEVAQGTSLHKDQYPETLEDASRQSKGEGDKQDDYGTSEVDARYEVADQSVKDEVAQGISLHKDQYPQIQENPSTGNTQARRQAGSAGASEKSV